MEIPDSLRSFTRSGATAFVVLAVSATVFTDQPKPRPTPRSGSLGAYARTITLNREKLAAADGRVVLTNERVSSTAEGGTISLGAVEIPGAKSSPSRGVADRAEQARWRAAYRKQRQQIAGLERRHDRVEIEIDHIKRQRLTIKTMARLQRAEAMKNQLGQDIAAERAELSRIVRDARLRGAEPGWFR
jgi:hypothetical protein